MVGLQETTTFEDRLSMRPSSSLDRPFLNFSKLDGAGCFKHASNRSGGINLNLKSGSELVGVEFGGAKTYS
jgi:hypothetical protein